MRVLYVGDNRNRRNWGCRATSIALYQLLSSEFEVVGILSGEYSDSYPSLPKFSTNALLSQESLVHLRRWKKRFFSLTKNVWFAKNQVKRLDYITENPLESLSNFFKYSEKYSEIQYIYDQVALCDIVVINGEGSLIFTTPPRRDSLFFLMMMELSWQLKKEIFYVNAIISDCPISGRNAVTIRNVSQSLQRCKLVAVRDQKSFELVQSIAPDVNCRYVPDALFSWYSFYDQIDNVLPYIGNFLMPFPEENQHFERLDFSHSYICIGGGSLCPKDPIKAEESYVYLTNKLKKLNLPIYLVQTCDGDIFLENVSQRTGIHMIPVTTNIFLSGAILANARLFISGRYHPSILASLGGTPCILLGSNSHKTYSLQEVLEYKNPVEFSAFPTEEECEQIFSMSLDYINQGKSFRTSIKQVSRKRAADSKKITEVIRASLSK